MRTVNDVNVIHPNGGALMSNEKDKVGCDCDEKERVAECDPDCDNDCDEDNCPDPDCTDGCC